MIWKIRMIMKRFGLFILGERPPEEAMSICTQDIIYACEGRNLHKIRVFIGLDLLFAGCGIIGMIMAYFLTQEFVARAGMAGERFIMYKICWWVIGISLFFVGFMNPIERHFRNRRLGFKKRP
jgi:hypothetical protein